MISHLQGKVLVATDTSITLDVQGVGYKISVIGNSLARLKEGVEASLWTHLAVRENALDLYGFLTRDELIFFELLITISGIGPKTALGILNVANIETLKQAVLTGNAGHLTKVSGIGKKNAEKIVLELNGKLVAEDGVTINLKDEGDVVEALMSLGYGQKEAREILREIPEEVTSTSDKVKYALKLLGKQ